MKKIKVKNLKDTLNSCPGLSFLWEPGEIKEVDEFLVNKYVKVFGEDLEILEEKQVKKEEKLPEKEEKKPKTTKKRKKSKK